MLFNNFPTNTNPQTEYLHGKVVERKRVPTRESYTGPAKANSTFQTYTYRGLIFNKTMSEYVADPRIFLFVPGINER